MACEEERVVASDMIVCQMLGVHDGEQGEQDNDLAVTHQKYKTLWSSHFDT